METMLCENLKKVEDNVDAACRKAGRSRDEVTLIAVSKTKPVEMLSTIYNQGIRDFGENKVQEMCDKMEQLPSDIRWHMVGHLQTNKVKYIVGHTTLIHSVDSLHLAKEIEKQAEKKDVTVDILVEVNIAEEESKFGVTCKEVLPLIQQIAHFKNIHICGLMTIAPNVSNPEENRVHFRNLHKLLVDINGKNIDNINMNELSMGMTGDYEVAIEEGATYVRVGTGIFGNRQYL